MKTILVQHRSVNTKKGVSLEKSKPVIRNVKAVMIDGDVMDHVGEVWEVKPCSSGRADYETVSNRY